MKNLGGGVEDDEDKDDEVEGSDAYVPPPSW